MLSSFPEVDMATLTHTFKPKLFRISLIKKWDNFIEMLLPRRCMLVSAGLILAGLSLPVLMVIGLLPATWLLAFMGFALVATGGVLALTLCGEI
jgi:hypothetical protein